MHMGSGLGSGMLSGGSCVSAEIWRHLEIDSRTWRCVREGIQTQRWKSMDSVGEKLSGAGSGDRRRGRVNYKRWWELN